jgi:hypothetical protein
MERPDGSPFKVREFIPHGSMLPMLPPPGIIVSRWATY